MTTNYVGQPVSGLPGTVFGDTASRQTTATSNTVRRLNRLEIFTQGHLLVLEVLELANDVVDPMTINQRGR